MWEAKFSFLGHSLQNTSGEGIVPMVQLRSSHFTSETIGGAPVELVFDEHRHGPRGQAASKPIYEMFEQLYYGTTGVLLDGIQANGEPMVSHW